MLHSQLAYPILKLCKVAMAHDSISLYLRKAYFCKARCLFNSVYFSSLFELEKMENKSSKWPKRDFEPRLTGLQLQRAYHSVKLPPLKVTLSGFKPTALTASCM